MLAIQHQYTMKLTINTTTLALFASVAQVVSDEAVTAYLVTASL